LVGYRRDFVAALAADAVAAPVVESVQLHGGFQPPVHLAVGTPGSLLAAAAEVAVFHGREHALDALERWRAQPGTVSVTLVSGEGGQGKTRLARQFLRSTPASWVSGFLPTPRTSDPQIFGVAGMDERWLDRVRSSSAPMLMVADYAETHPDRVARLIDELTVRPPQQPVRLLLLARRAGAWWATLRDDMPGTVVQDAALAPLAPLLADRGGRVAEFDAATAAFASALAAMPDLPPVDWQAFSAHLAANRPRLDDGRYANVLTLHMAALAALLRYAYAEDRAESLANLLDPELELVAHERRYQQRAALRRGLLDHGVVSQLRDRDERHAQALRRLRRAVAGCILCGPADQDQAEMVAALAGGEGIADVVGWLAGLYPPGSADPTAVIGAVQPDRLAERLLGHTLIEQPDTLPAAAMLIADEPTAIDALTVLARAAARPAYTARLTEQIAALIDSQPDRLAVAAQYAAVTVDQPAPLLAGLHRYGIRDLPSLIGHIDQVIDRMPRHSTSLASYLAQLAGQHTTILRSLTSQLPPQLVLPDLARLVNSHAVRLAAAGRRAEALAMSQEAVDLRRMLVADNRDARLPALAASINNLAVDLGESGRRAEALAAAQEAVDLYRELTTSDRHAHLPDLAMAVNNHAIRLAEAGRRAEALAAAQQAVDLYRELTDGNRHAHLAALAASVNNLAVYLADAGRSAQAASVAIEPLRQPEAGDRDVLTRDLATSVHNHAAMLALADWRAEALTAAQEAVTLRRELAAGSRDAYESDPAMPDHHDAAMPAHWRAQALAAAQEAVTLRRKLAAGSRDADAPHLAMRDNDHAATPAEVSRRAYALAMSQEAVDLRRELASVFR